MKDLLVVGLFFCIWLVSGFIAFLIEARRLKCYKTFDKTAQADCIFLTVFGLFSFAIEIILLFIKWFVDLMNKFLKKINQ